MMIIEQSMVLSAVCLLVLGGGAAVYLLVYQVKERSRLEAAFAASREELMQNNAKLYEALETVRRVQDRMIQQEKLAGIGQLAGGVAHEINNPLGYVSGNFDTLEEYFDGLQQLLVQYGELRDRLANAGEPELREQADEIARLAQKIDLSYILGDLPGLFSDTRDGLQRIADIVAGLGLFARVDQPVFEPYDINMGVEKALLVAHNELKYQAAVATDLAAVALIEAMGGEISQAILNLLLNAAQAIQDKHSEEKGMIRLATSMQEDEVVLRIQDNGVGIDKDHIKSIFNPFFTTKPVGRGTGLGLSIAYEIIVNRHHGEITVESLRGEGTTFTVKLPVRQPDGVPGEKRRGGESGAEDPAGR